jgi:hypothetical protein
MHKEFGSCGDHAEISLHAGATQDETVGVEGFYHVECRDANGNVKWTENFPNQVVQVGKIFMLSQTLLSSPVALVGPYLGLVSGSGNTFSPTDTMTSHSGWTEFTAYTVSSSAVRGTAVFTTPTGNNNTTSGSNVVTASASAITYTITGSGGTIGGCFLVTGTGASSTLGNTGGTLYSAGAFGTAKTTTAGDTVAVTYSTTATS